MKLQPIEYHHLSACAALFVSVFNNPPWNEVWSQEIALNRLKDCYNTPGAYGIIGIVDDEVYGFAMGVIEQYDRNENFYLKEMCVNSTQQRSGIGTKIIDVLYQNLTSKGINMIYLLTMRDTPAAYFYEKCGFLSNPNMIEMTKYAKT